MRENICSRRDGGGGIRTADGLQVHRLTWSGPTWIARRNNIVVRILCSRCTDCAHIIIINIVIIIVADLRLLNTYYYICAVYTGLLSLIDDKNGENPSSTRRRQEIAALVYARRRKKNITFTRYTIYEQIWIRVALIGRLYVLQTPSTRFKSCRRTAIIIYRIW